MISSQKNPLALTIHESLGHQKLTSLITIGKASCIKNDPNDWCKEHNNPRSIIDLV